MTAFTAPVVFASLPKEIMVVSQCEARMAKKRLPCPSAVPVLRGAAFSALFQRIRDILEHARRQIVRSVNSEMVRAYWLIGREIVEEEQHGQARAGYGEALIV